jgi:1-acyl-sn-glycerol-3-phosphate acyltransferase
MAAITTTLLSVFGGFVTVWTDFWKVLLLFVGSYWAWFVVVIIFAFFVTLPINTKKPVKKSNKFYTWLFNFINGWIIDTAGVKLKVTGLEKVDPNTSYLFVYNHRSNFDSQIVPRLFKKHKILLISKPENIKIPIAGKCIHAAGFLPIDRDNDRKAIETILKAANNIKKGHSIHICPEGTRNKDGVDLLPFKNGGFKAAQRAKAPIALIAINGTEKIHKNFPFKRTVVHFDIVDVLSAEQALAMSTQEIGDHAMQVIQAKIDEYKAQN